MSQSEDPKNNVIPFPEPKAKARVRPSQPNAQDRSVGRFSQHQRQAQFLGGAILSIFICMIIANNKFIQGDAIQNTAINSTQSNLGARNLASVSPQPIQRDVAWEKKLGKQLQGKDSQRSVASFGESPTVEQELRFVTLEGNYAFRFDIANNKLSEIKFPENDEGTMNEVRPSYITDREGFLNSNRSLFSVDFDSVQSQNRQIKDNRVQESYALLDASQKPVGHAHFELDIHERLLSVRISPSPVN